MMHDELLTPEEKETIRKYAAISLADPQDRRLLHEAIAVYREHIAEHVKGDRNQCPEMEFMSEVLHPCPDYGYRARLRRKITALRGK